MCSNIFLVHQNIFGIALQGVGQQRAMCGCGGGGQGGGGAGADAETQAEGGQAAGRRPRPLRRPRPQAGAGGPPQQGEAVSTVMLHKVPSEGSLSRRRPLLGPSPG